MNKDNLKKMRRYIRFYNIIKSDRSKAKFHINKDSGASFAVSETESEVIFTFFSDKNSFKFIKNYSDYKRLLKIEDERESSEISFNEIVKHIPENKFMNYCQNKKLNNPFRNTNIRNFLHSPLKQDRMCYYDFFAHKIKFYVHSGFVLLFNSIAPKLFKEIEKYLTKTDKKIVIVGFSFATVIARLAYLVYFLKFPTNLDRIECYLFSTPNIGNKYFERFYESLHRKEKFRRLFIVNCDDDCVYNMLSKRFGFRYMKSTYLIKKDKSTKRIYTSEEYEKEINSIII